MGLKGHNADRLAVLVHDFQSYDDRDQGNQLLPFTLSHPHGMHFVQAVLRDTMTRAFNFFFFIYFYF